MRLVFLDEAGTDKSSAFRIVSGIIINPDIDHEAIESELSKIYDHYCPAAHRELFKFHATEIYGGKGHFGPPAFSISDRMDFITSVLEVPLKFGAQIPLGAVRQGGLNDIDKIYYSKHRNIAPSIVDGKRKMKQITTAKMEHLSAFINCIDRADLFIARMLDKPELAMLVLEDLPDMRQSISDVFELARQRPKSSDVTGDFPRKINSVAPPSIHGTPRRFKSFINAPLFCEKGKSPMLDIADAICFAFRRSLNKQPNGDKMVKSAIGDDMFARFEADELWNDHGSISMLFHQNGMDGEKRKMGEQLWLNWGAFLKPLPGG